MMALAIARTPLRTRVYIDGYNLYYGCLKGTPYKWLDMLVLFIEGYYSLTESKVKAVNLDVPQTWPRECQDVLIWKLEEKQSDVNLALHAYHDAITAAVDQVVIVTNDTDISPALRMIRQNTNATVGLVVPTTQHVRTPDKELADLSHWVRSHITAAELAASQLPRVIPGRRPTIKPESWYARPDLLEVLDYIQRYIHQAGNT